MNRVYVNWKVHMYLMFDLDEEDGRQDLIETLRGPDVLNTWTREFMKDDDFTPGEVVISYGEALPKEVE
mgnify:CR=1 FL=1